MQSQPTEHSHTALGVDSPKPEVANHPQQCHMTSNPDSACYTNRDRAGLPGPTNQSAHETSRGINNITQVFGEHHAIAKTKTNAVQKAFYYALRQKTKFLKSFVEVRNDNNKVEYKIRSDIKPIPETSKLSMKGLDAFEGRFHALKDEAEAISEEDDILVSHTTNFSEAARQRTAETHTVYNRNIDRSFKRNFRTIFGPDKVTDTFPSEIMSNEDEVAEVPKTEDELDKGELTIKETKESNKPETDSEPRNILTEIEPHESETESNPEEDNDYGILNAVMTIPSKMKIRKLVNKSLVVRSHRRLTNFLKIKHCMKSRTVPLINTMITDARVWLMKDGRKCETDEDYIVMTSSVMAAYMVQEEELAFRELLRNVENHRNARDLNSLIDDGILGHVGPLDQFKYTESSINKLKPVLKMPVSIGHGF